MHLSPDDDTVSLLKLFHIYDLMESESCFQDLSIIDKQDWNNIPQPLIKALKTIKKCIIGLVYKFKENNDHIQEVERESLFKINEFDTEVKNIRKTSIATEDSVKGSIQELKEQLESSLSTSAKLYSSEFESLKKISDSKFTLYDQNFKGFSNNLKTFPKYDEVEKMIKAALKENNGKFEVEIKEDVKSNFIDPEMRKIENKFDQLEFYKEEVKQKLLEQTEERSKILKSLVYEFDQKITKTKKNQEILMEKLEKIQEENDFSANEAQGRMDNLNKTFTEKNRALEYSIEDTYERFLKFSQEIHSKIESLSHEIRTVQNSFTEQLHEYESKDYRESPEPKETKTPPREEQIVQSKPKKMKKKKVQKSQPDLTENFKQLKAESLETMKNFEELFKNSSKKISEDVDGLIQDLRKDMNESVFEIREKLHWLPVNISEIKGMNPSEARIFILEARLRAEENARNEQVSKLFSALETLKSDLRCTSETTNYGVTFPSITNNTQDTRSNDWNLKEFSKRVVSSIRDVPTPERLRQKPVNHPRLFLSVDLRRGNRRLST